MPRMALPRETRYEPQHECRQSARLAFRKHFGDRYFDITPWRCGVDGEGRSIPAHAQHEIAKEVGRLSNAPPTIARWFVENHTDFFDNLIVTGFAAISSCGAGGALGHWYQDAAKKFDLLHPSLGAIFGAIGGIAVCLWALGNAHRKLVEASLSEKRYEKSIVAADALISGYITEPEVQDALLAAVKERRRRDGGWPEPVRFKILEIRACGVLAPQAKERLF